MIDLTRTEFNEVKELQIATGSTISAEGRCVLSALSSGEIVVSPSLGTTADDAKNFEGVSVNTSLTPTYFPNVETGAVPAASPYTVQLEKTNLVVGQLRVVGSTTGNLTLTLTTPSAGEVQYNATTGLLTFNSAQASETLAIQYHYQPTTAEANAKFWSGHSNGDAAAQFGFIGCGKGPGRFYTTEFDATKDWSSLSTGVYSGAGGKFTDGGDGQALPLYVIHVPSVSDPFLGLEWKAGS